MKSLVEIGAELDCAGAPANELLGAAELTLEHWLRAHGTEPTEHMREGFRLLALHRQGAKNDPSFNACRETCRELAYHYNLVMQAPDHTDAAKRLEMMRYVARHLYFFVSGKLEQSQLGDFCCSSKTIRQAVQ